MRQMEPLTLEDSEERACFASLAKPQMQEGDFWISGLRQLENRVWCLQENYMKPMDIKAANLQVQESEQQADDEIMFLHVSNLTGETVVLKEEIGSRKLRSFACKVNIYL